jgi:hypothetical protein
MDWDQRADERGCYCGGWATRPDELRASGLEEGYCGTCCVCGKPGHLRHHPRAPYTDAWCDEHFKREQWVSLFMPSGPIGCLVLLGVAVLGVVGVVRLIAWMF